MEGVTVFGGPNNRSETMSKDRVPRQQETITKKKKRGLDKW